MRIGFPFEAGPGAGPLFWCAFTVPEAAYGLFTVVSDLHGPHAIRGSRPTEPVRPVLSLVRLRRRSDAVSR
ncbi:hypothetical protein NBRGN_065_01260 [Nocardia brasiliensis NBRC 14402]|nr:hypothetical protein NBRGN_065_01260 [Nocardia brasiliensis NBRC 14402]